MDTLPVIINLIIVSGIVYYIYKRYPNGKLRAFYFPLLLLKLIAGLGLGWVYTNYYEWGDTINYFAEGERLASIARLDFYQYLKEILNNSGDFISRFDNQPRALLISKITSIFALITGTNYWLIAIYYSLFAFTGFWLLSGSLIKITKNYSAILLSLFLFPSVVFWSSGLSKESFAILALALLIKIFVDLIYLKNKLSVAKLLIVVISIWLLWSLKYYYAGAFILFSISGGLLYYLTQKYDALKGKWTFQVIIMIGLTVLLTLIVSKAHLNFNLDRIATVIYENNQAYIHKSATEDVIVFENLKPTLLSVFVNSPKALLSGLYRPLPGDGSGILSWVVKVENVFLIALTLSSVIAMFKVRLNDRDKFLMMSGVSYCCFLAIFLTLSAPNFGTLSRYKIGFMPIFLLLLTIPNPFILKLNKWLFSE